MNKVIKVDFRNEKYSDCIDEEDSKMFFLLKNALFDYTNQKYHINKELEDFEDICTSEPEEIMEIREKIWNDTNVIKEFVKDNKKMLGDEVVEVLNQWNQKKVNKEFMLYKYEKEYAIFMDEYNVYYVKGLKDSIQNMIPENKLPIFVKTVLLPFKDKIIYDSYIQEFNISVAKGMKDMLDKDYNEKKKQNRVKYKL